MNDNIKENTLKHENEQIQHEIETIRQDISIDQTPEIVGIIQPIFSLAEKFIENQHHIDLIKEQNLQDYRNKQLELHKYEIDTNKEIQLENIKTVDKINKRNNFTKRIVYFVSLSCIVGLSILKIENTALGAVIGGVSIAAILNNDLLKQFIQWFVQNKKKNE